MAPVAPAAATAKTHIFKDCSLRSLLEPSPPFKNKFVATKVTITIGPACQDVETLVELLEAGVTCARLDLTWGSLEFHQHSLDNLQVAMRRSRKLCAVMLETTGRELMLMRDCELDATGYPLYFQPLTVKAGATVTITVDRSEADDSRLVLPISYPKFPAMCEVGDTIFMGRYLVTGTEEFSVYLEVTGKTDKHVTCVAKSDCTMQGLITIFHIERSVTGLTNLQNDLPILRDTDKAALQFFASRYDIDFVSLSFTRSRDDVVEAREFLDSVGLTSTKVLAKCESRQSLFNFNSIVAASDGIIISRGNLGLDVLPEKMALTQKRMVCVCNMYGKPCCMTRVVDTMINVPRPTRAEATDVANAVLDGVDGIMLGAETLRGKFPGLTVRTVLAICAEAELVFDHNHHYEYLTTVQVMGGVEGRQGEYEDEEGLEQGVVFRRTSSGASLNSSEGRGPSLLNSNWNLSQMAAATRGVGAKSLSKLESIASSAVRAAHKVAARLIMVYTQTGRTASLVAKYRPPVPILTLVVPTLVSDGLKWSLEGKYVARQCLFEHGLLPVLAAPSPSGETLMEEAVALCSRRGLLHAGDHIIIVQQVHDDVVLKIVSVDELGLGIKKIRSKSLRNLVAAQMEDAPKLDDSFSVIGGGQELVHDDFQQTGVSQAASRRGSMHPSSQKDWASEKDGDTAFESAATMHRN